jgi:uncharacterized membrane protein YfcA
MYMLSYAKELLKIIFHSVFDFLMDFTIWVWSISEEIIGTSFGFYAILNIQLGGEIIHSIFQLATGLLTAYCIFRLKQVKFKISFKWLKKVWTKKKK